VLLDQLTVWQVASDPASLKLILVGCAISLPAIAGYTVFVYRIFGGKTGALTYG
jgi:cytochrome d ubiquinol oxidase subunit II